MNFGLKQQNLKKKHHRKRGITHSTHEEQREGERQRQRQRDLDKYDIKYWRKTFTGH